MYDITLVRIVFSKKHHEHFIRPPVTPYGRPKKPARLDETDAIARNVKTATTDSSKNVAINVS